MTTTATTLVAPGSLRAWLIATRPATLTAGAVPVMVGVAIACRMGHANLLAASAAFLGAMGIQIGTNLANDVFDFEKGADTELRKGPIRVTQAGLLAARQVRAGMLLSFLFATVAGSYLVAVGGWPIVAIGIASVASGVAYTGGPWPLGYHGLGDVFVFVFFGLVAVCGTVYVVGGSVPAIAWWCAVSVGGLATAVLVVNNVRDIETDVVAGKRTLAVRFGRRCGVCEYAALLVLAYAVPIVLCATHRLALWSLLPCVTLPWGVGLVRTLATQTSAERLNLCLVSTARLLLVFGALLTMSLVL